MSGAGRDLEREKWRTLELGEPPPLGKFEISLADGRPYLTRHDLLYLPDGGHVLLHQIHASDDSREFHDHPWAFRSYIVSGAYVEHTPVFLDGDGSTSRAWFGNVSHQKTYRAGDWSLRPDPAAVHRVEVIEHPCITVVYRGPRMREWGFLLEDGTWVRNQDYLDRKFGPSQEKRTT